MRLGSAMTLTRTSSMASRTNFDGTQVATSGYRRAVVRDNWKLIYDLDFPAELYNLAVDPGELNNLAADPHYAAVRAALQEALLNWAIRLDDNMQVKRYAPKRLPHNWRQ